MKTIVKTTTKRATWMGGPGTLNVAHLDKSRHGLQITALHFDGHAQTKLELIKGDGRTIDFKVYASFMVEKHEYEAKFNGLLQLASTL